MIDKRIRQLPHISFAGDTRGDLFARTWQFISGSSSIYVAALIASAAGAIIVSLIQFAGFFVQAARQHDAGRFVCSDSCLFSDD